MPARSINWWLMTSGVGGDFFRVESGKREVRMDACFFRLELERRIYRGGSWG